MLSLTLIYMKDMFEVLMGNFKTVVNSINHFLDNL